MKYRINRGSIWNHGSHWYQLSCPFFTKKRPWESVIDKIQDTYAKHNINGEIVVCDNDSTDNSVKIAESRGAMWFISPGADMAMHILRALPMPQESTS